MINLCVTNAFCHGPVANIDDMDDDTMPVPRRGAMRRLSAGPRTPHGEMLHPLTSLVRVVTRVSVKIGKRHNSSIYLCH